MKFILIFLALVSAVSAYAFSDGSPETRELASDPERIIYLAGRYQEGQPCMVKYGLSRAGKDWVLSDFQTTADDVKLNIRVSRKPSFFGLLAPRFVGESVETIATGAQFAVYVVANDLRAPASIGYGLKNGDRVRWDRTASGRTRETCGHLAAISREEFEKGLAAATASTP